VSPFAECLGTTLNFVLTTREDEPHGLVGGREEKRKKEEGTFGPFYGGAAPFPVNVSQIGAKASDNAPS
jgi:hypothetical protein